MRNHAGRGRGRWVSIVAGVALAAVLSTHTTTAGAIPSETPSGGDVGVLTGGTEDPRSDSAGTEALVDTTFVDAQIGGAVNAFAVQDDDKIVVGGTFSTIAGEARAGVGRLNADGTLDTSFVDPQVDGSVDAVAIQADGKVVIGGNFTSVDGETRLRVARLNTDGSLDMAFDPAVDSAVGTVVAQADGTILIAGPFFSVEGENRTNVARLEADGDLDAGFADPLLTHEYYSPWVADLVVQGDGQLVIGGRFSAVDGVSRQGVARLNTDGTLDETFADVQASGVEALALEDDGDVLFGGTFDTVGGQIRWGVARVGDDGTLDGTFVVPPTSALSSVRALAVQDDGKVVVGTWSGSPGGARTLARLNTDGTPDTGFPDAYFDGGVFDIEVLDDGILVGGAFGDVDYRARHGMARVLDTPTPLASTPDTSFSGDGRAEADPSSGDDYANDVAVQADGRIVVAGRFGGRGGRFGVARFLDGGTLDTSFSGDGWTATDFTPGWDEAEALAIDASQRIVLAGNTDTGRFALTRYLPNGALDTSFSGDGKVVTDVTSGFDWITSMAIQPDGKIVVAGGVGGQGGRFGVARYQADGSLDTTFSGNGWAAVDFSTRPDWAWDMALQADGGIVLAGIVRGGSGTTDPTMALVRFSPNGALDPTFSGDGKFVAGLGPRPEIAAAVQVDAEDRIVVAGQYGLGRNGDFMTARFTPSGTFDSSFGQNGKVIYRFATTSEDWAWDLAVDEDSRVLVVGVTPHSGGAFALVRFRENGWPDPSFGGNGWKITNFTPDFDGALAVELQPDGRIVAAGGSNGAQGRIAVARYHG